MFIKKGNKQMPTNHPVYLKAWKEEVRVRKKEGQFRPEKKRDRPESPGRTVLYLSSFLPGLGLSG